MNKVTIVMMGSDKMGDRLQKLTYDMGVEDKVMFRNPVKMDEVNSYVAGADIGIVPTQAANLSFYHSNENKLFHYLMASIPVAVSNHPEKRWIVETYDVGAVFDETDPGSIARTVNTLLSDRNRYREMCANAHRVSRERLNWKVESKKLRDLYARFESAL